MKKWLFVLVTTLFALVLVACTANEEARTDKSQEKDGGDTDTQETGEKTLYINNDQEPTSFDPSMGFDSVSWDPLNQIMEGLMRLDENFEPQEAIAESYEVSDDGLTYTFILRDTTWFNGDVVTARSEERRVGKESRNRRARGT